MKKPSTDVRSGKLLVKKNLKPGVAARVRAAQRPRGAVAKPRTAAAKSRIALAMAGGGPLGAIYEIGALTALSEALDGIDLNTLDLYIGVSAGGILGAGLANGITPRQMCGMFIESDDATAPHQGPFATFDPAALMRPAFGEYWSSGKRLPPLLAKSIWQFVVEKRGREFWRSFQRLSRAIPSGLFSNQRLIDFLEQLFEQPGRSNDFRQLRARLLLIATDLDSGRSVQFGGPGYDHVPISLAAGASSALPGIFPPVAIDGRHYVDGALKRTLHTSVALRAGADLVLCLNPIVPYDDSVQSDASERGRPHRYGGVGNAGGARSANGGPNGSASTRLADGGLPVVLAQTVRAVIHSRMEIGMRQYADDFPNADVLLFEPHKRDAAMFFTNMFSYSGRRKLCEHAYQTTRAELLERRHELAPVLARHGITLNLGVLRDSSLTLVKSEAKAPPRRALLPVTAVAGRLAGSLDDLERFVRYIRARRASAAA